VEKKENSAERVKVTRRRGNDSSGAATAIHEEKRARELYRVLKGVSTARESKEIGPRRKAALGGINPAQEKRKVHTGRGRYRTDF